MEFLHRHTWALVIAVFIGLCTVAPAIIAPLYLKDAYQGIQFAPLDNEEEYRVRIHEILDGHFLVAQPHLFEYKSSAVPMPPLNEWLYALPAFIFGLSAVVVASKFLLPAALFFLAYLLLRRMTDDHLTAIAGGLLTFFSVEFVDYGYMLSLLQGGWPRPLVWTRLVNPITGAVEVLAFLNLVWFVIMRSWRHAYVVAGVVLALSVGYYFSFGICAAVLGAVLCIYLYRRDYDIVRQLIATGAIALVLTIPFWYIVLGAIGGSKEAAERTGMFFTHAPVFNKLLFAATLIVLGACAYAWRQGKIREAPAQWVFALALIAAGWIAFNEQVITGREIWHHHFVQYTIPLSVIAVIIVLFFSARAWPRLWRSMMIASLVLSLSFGAYSVTHVVPRLDSFARMQSFGGVANWLDANAQADCTVLVREKNDMLARYIPAYSQCNVYITTYTFASVPRERLEHNFFVFLWLNGVDADEVQAHLQAHEDAVLTIFYEDWNQALMGAETPWLPDKIIELSSGYREFAQVDIETQLTKYRVDYFVSDGPLEPGMLRQLPHVHEQAVVGEWHVYAFNFSEEE